MTPLAAEMENVLAESDEMFSWQNLIRHLYKKSTATEK